jgi:hypothetical protein
MDKNFSYGIIGTNRDAILSSFADHIQENSTYTGIYIPNGQQCTLTVTYNPVKKEIISHEWEYDEYSTFKEGSKVPAQVHYLVTQIEKSLNAAFKRRKRKYSLYSELFGKDPIEKTLRFHMVWSKDRKDIANKQYPEDYMREFLYIWMVEFIDLEDSTYHKYLPLVNWLDCFYTTGDLMIMSGPTVSSRQVYIQEASQEFLRTLARNPFLRALRPDKNMYNVCVKNGHIGVHKFVYLPNKPYLYQRTESWLQIDVKL